MRPQHPVWACLAPCRLGYGAGARGEGQHRGLPLTPRTQFGEKLAARFKPEQTVILMDVDGTLGKAAGEAGIAAGLEKVYFVSGGAAQWQASGAPWREPSKASFSLSAITDGIDALAEDFKEAPTLAKSGLALGALVGAGALLFNELETVIEVVGSLAIANVAIGTLLSPPNEEVAAAGKAAAGARGKDEEELKKQAKDLLNEAKRKAAQAPRAEAPRAEAPEAEAPEAPEAEAEEEEKDEEPMSKAAQARALAAAYDPTAPRPVLTVAPVEERKAEVQKMIEEWKAKQKPGVEA